MDIEYYLARNKLPDGHHGKISDQNMGKLTGVCNKQAQNEEGRMGQKNIEISQRNVGPLQNYPVNMRDFYNVLICHACSTPLEHYAVATILEQYPEQPEGNGIEAEAYRKTYDLMVPDMVIEDWEHYYEWLIERTEDEHIVIESIRRYNIVASAMHTLDWAGWTGSRGEKTYGGVS